MGYKSKVTNAFELAIAFAAYPLFCLAALLPERMRIYFSKLHGLRIGHLAGDFFIELSRKIDGRTNTILYYIDYEKRCCNFYLSSLVRRHLNVHLLSSFYFKASVNLPLSRRLHIPGPFDSVGSRFVSGPNERLSSYSLFSPKEDECGLQWLRKKGKKNNQPLVLLLNRDSGYLANAFPEMNSRNHDYRNSSINSYSESVKWLTDEKDAFVVRMGRISNQRSNVESPSFVDYPFCDDKSEFLDVWLFANCDFYIATGTGPDIIPAYLNKPGLLVNFIPFCHAPTYTNSYIVPKKIFCKRRNRQLDFEETLQCTLNDQFAYDAAQLVPTELSGNEILQSLRQAWAALFEECDSASGYSPGYKERFFSVAKKHFPSLHSTPHRNLILDFYEDY